ncbi:MAG: ankyrin repeat domain-containing protein [Pontixanthobacter sp.]
MATAVFRKILAPFALAALLAAAPAAAQFKTDGSKFLAAVRDSEGEDATEALKEAGSVVVNSRDITTGETGLHIAARRRDTLWIRFLIQNGANPNIREGKDRKGDTPLQISAMLGPTEAVEALIDAGANVDDPNVAGETPLISAVHRNDIAMVRLLLSKGANLDRKDNSGRSARDYAALQSGNDRLLSELKKADEDKASKGSAPTYGPIF